MEEVKEIGGKKWSFPVGGNGASMPKEPRKKNDGKWDLYSHLCVERGSWKDPTQRLAQLFVFVRRYLKQQASNHVELLVATNKDLISELPAEAKRNLHDILLEQHKKVASSVGFVFDAPCEKDDVVINLLPYIVVVANGEDCWRFKPSGKRTGISNPGAETTNLNGTPVLSVWREGVVDIPAPTKGTSFIVPPEVLDALPERTDLYAPDPYINVGEAHGIILGVRLRCHNGSECCA